jgi:hypothetical protein
VTGECRLTHINQTERFSTGCKTYSSHWGQQVETNRKDRTEAGARGNQALDVNKGETENILQPRKSPPPFIRVDVDHSSGKGNPGVDGAMPCVNKRAVTGKWVDDFPANRHHGCPTKCPLKAGTERDNAIRNTHPGETPIYMGFTQWHLFNTNNHQRLEEIHYYENQRRVKQNDQASNH